MTEQSYIVTIHYVDQHLTELAKPHSMIMLEGEQFSVTILMFEGYYYLYTFAESYVVHGDMDVYLVYAQFVSYYTVDDYLTPLGLPMTVLQVGVCYE